MKTIEMTVLPSGETKLETKGFVGAECQTSSRTFIEALGLPQHSHRTAEYYLAEQVAAQLAQGRS